MKFQIDEFIENIETGEQMQVIEIEEDGYLCYIDQGFSGTHCTVSFSQEHLYESSYN